ncbi:unnamed protein product [Sphenostylis stenocarpa]|uniref:Uncharacterized protein n=1 Tax=Sphenostylis stenocarpa TaxID=92480 RepID=A0AA86THF8_9FABA|nr:unnamed protein product [Sphenostylis stenocarpa]
MSALRLNNPQCGPMPTQFALGSKFLSIQMPNPSEQIVDQWISLARKNAILEA